MPRRPASSDSPPARITRQAKVAAKPRKAAYKRDTYHHGDLRQSLIKHTISAISELGPASTSLREVARRADVSAAAAFHHFEDKTDLLAAVATNGFERLIAIREEAHRGVTDPALRLRISVETYVQFAIENPAVFHLMFGPLVAPRDRYPELQAVAEKCLRMLADTVRAYVRMFGPEPRHIGAEAWTVWASMHGLSSLLVDFPSSRERPDRLANDRLVATLVETLMAGLEQRARALSPDNAHER